ncbi:cytochrome P450 [Rhizoctonia solani AG-1 IA]|uniref:Cytochrome P450 n=1 Tax=Thanatephorus cucumeris (strain AG1-IA) TaxID=983506 RepID=L8WLF8_THACA|nr:cytochrome P450 [Rhizoctonia solani AG-1 IA]
MWDIILVVAAFALSIVALRHGKASRLPPGPPGNLFFGNALEKNEQPTLPRALRYTWRNCKSSSTALTGGEGRGEREIKGINKLSRSGWAEAILFVPYGPRLRSYRRLLHQTLNPRATLDFEDLQIQEVRKLMKRLLMRPEDFLDHICLPPLRYAGAVSIRIAYGHTARDFSDEFIQGAEEFMRALSEGVLGLIKYGCPRLSRVFKSSNPSREMRLHEKAYSIKVVRYIPSWFPGATFKRKTEQWARMTVQYRQGPFDYVLKHMTEGTAEPSFTSKLLDPADGSQVGESERDMIKQIVASHLYGAGADTTASIIQSFFLAMTLYPDVQSTAQAELDAYLASKRTLTVSDWEHLPYTNAIVMESLRWHPVTNIIARKTKEDEVVGEWVIPSGTYVIGNLWAILHNPEIYPDPCVFKPERYLGNEPAPDPAMYGFGFGRRHIALQSLWLVISNILANFEISKFCTPDGEEVTPGEEYTSGILSRPLPFKNVIKPRSLACRAMVDEVEI